MQLKDDIKNCNGCEACAAVCKNFCIKIHRDENGVKYPVVNEDGCRKCNNCKLYCPLFRPVDMPKFDEFYKYSDEIYERDMAKTYRETIKRIKAGQATEFAGTLCQIAALKSLLGNKFPPNLTVSPIHCDMDHPKREACKHCPFH